MDLDALLADPPQVHPGAPSGVWGSSRSLYELIAANVGPGDRTLETGLGISTAVFAALGAQHTCIVGDQAQIDRLRAWGKVDLSHVTFHADTSDRVLPTLAERLDLVLVDGSHGYPAPVIDWYYTARLLVPGGIAIIDDRQLPQVADYLIRFLDADPRWIPIAATEHWAAYRRGDHDVREEWTDQPFLGPVAVPIATRLKVAVNRRLPARLRR